MAFQYLKEDTIVDVFQKSQQYTDKLTDNFTEYERLARNKPHPSIAKELPKTTDGTTASIIRKTPHRVIQQLPTGFVRSDGPEWLAIIAQFIYTHKIIAYANTDYALLQKCWLVVEKFLTYGFCPTYAPFLDHGGYLCTDLKLPYWGDIFLQPGKLSDEASSYIFMRSWWQTEDLDALIDQQSKIKGTTWNIDALRRVKESTETKDEKAKTQIEKDKAISQGGIALITGFQRGVGAKFYTFHVNSGEIVRVKENKDPRGELPISFAYGDMDGANPFGRSIIDLVGGMQNLMDGEMQMYQFNRALMLGPPLVKKGDWDKTKVKFAPNVVIDIGNDTNASLEALNIDNSSLQNFSNNYSLMKSQLLNLLSSPDTSISSEAGNPGFSKTPAGVKQLQSNVSVDDNYVRKQFETWFERWSETAINLFFAERSGIEELQLDQETADKLMELAKDGKFDPSMMTPDRKIMINYDDATPALHFEVDASSSKVLDDREQVQGLDLLKEALKEDPGLSALVGPQKKAEMWNALVRLSGVDNADQIKLSDNDVKAFIEQQAQDMGKLFEQLNIDFKSLSSEDQAQLLQKLFGIQSEGEPLAITQLRQKANSDILKTMHADKKAKMSETTKLVTAHASNQTKKEAAKQKPKASNGK